MAERHYFTVGKCIVDYTKQTCESACGKGEIMSKVVFENECYSQGFERIAGIDEAGRGPLAGPVVSAACIIPKDLLLEGVDDSKKLTPKKRGELFKNITNNEQIFYGVGIVDQKEIDRINILQATILSMHLAIDDLLTKPDYLLVDGLKLDHRIPSKKIIKGDSLSQSIGAASIIAKETRDQLMKEFHLKWPEYGFDRHKGYGTRAHIEAIMKHGPSPIHRLSFEPVKSRFIC